MLSYYIVNTTLYFRNKPDKFVYISITRVYNSLSIRYKHPCFKLSYIPEIRCTYNCNITILYHSLFRTLPIWGNNYFHKNEMQNKSTIIIMSISTKQIFRITVLFSFYCFCIMI